MNRFRRSSDVHAVGSEFVGGDVQFDQQWRAGKRQREFRGRGFPKYTLQLLWARTKLANGSLPSPMPLSTCYSVRVNVASPKLCFIGSETGPGAFRVMIIGKQLQLDL